MTITFRKWLAQRLTQIDSVQKCTGGPDSDLVIHSWRGVLIHVHILDAVVKTRQLKKWVQEATRIGNGTLFIVNRALMPPDGERLLPPEWLLAIHSLTDEKIYAYSEDDKGAQVIQVHFKLNNTGEERDVWHGAPIPLQQLPFFRHSVKMNAVKGEWLIANFGSDPFWRSSDYRTARAAAFDAQRRSQRAGSYQGYQFGYGGSMGAEVIPEAPRTRLDRSYATLGIPSTASCDEIKTAFRRLALEVHPDVTRLPQEEALHRFREIIDAYNNIREHRSCV